MEPIVLGLSGGVDSAVAGRLLLEQGFAVTGLYLDIGLGDSGRADAASVAQRLGIPLRGGGTSRAQLELEVCAPFAASYQAGQTPLPVPVKPHCQVPRPAGPGGGAGCPVCGYRPLRPGGGGRAEKGPARQRPALHAGPAHQKAITACNFPPRRLRKAGGSGAGPGVVPHLWRG